MPCPSVCSPGRKPAQEPPARGAVGTSGREGGWLWQEEKSLGTLAPTLGSSCNRMLAASALGQLPSAGRARADLCWPTAARPPRPCSCVTSSGRCPLVPVTLRRTTPAKTTSGWRDSKAGPEGWPWRESRQPWGSRSGGQRRKGDRNCSD